MIKKRIAFVISKLNVGGISSALCAFLTELDKYGRYDITLFILKRGNDSRFEMPKGIDIKYPSQTLNLWFARRNECKAVDYPLWLFLHIFGIRLKIGFVQELCFIKKISKEFDYAIAYENDINTPVFKNFMVNDFVLKCLAAKKKISWIHSDPYKLGFTKEFIDWRYKFFDAIVCVSNGARNKFLQIAPQYHKVYMMHNCITEEQVAKESVKKSEIDEKFHIVTVCRIANGSKRIDRSIDACVLLQEKGFKDSVIWHIYGDGEDMDKLCRYALEKGVNNMIRFEGKTNDPLTIISEHEIFVLNSDYESYPMVLIESIKAGTPVIVTDFDEAQEIIKNGENGIIVERTAEAVAEAIEQLMTDKDSLRKMRKYIKDHPIDNSEPMSQFEKMLDVLKHDSI